MSLHQLGNMNPGNFVFSVMLYTVSQKRNARREIVLTLLSTKNYYNWLMSAKDIASQSNIVFETWYTA